MGHLATGVSSRRESTCISRESVIFGELAFADKRYSCIPSDLLDEGVIGEGAFGTVCKMLHGESGTRMAVKVGILWNMEMSYIGILCSSCLWVEDTYYC